MVFCSSALLWRHCIRFVCSRGETQVSVLRMQSRRSVQAYSVTQSLRHSARHFVTPSLHHSQWRSLMSLRQSGNKAVSQPVSRFDLLKTRQGVHVGAISIISLQQGIIQCSGLKFSTLRSSWSHEFEECTSLRATSPHEHQIIVFAKRLRWTGGRVDCGRIGSRVKRGFKDGQAK